MMKHNNSQTARERRHEPENQQPGGHGADVVIGAMAVAAGVAVLLYAVSLPTLGDGRPGPGLFPGIAGSLFVFFGSILSIRALLLRRKTLRDESHNSPTIAPAPADQEEAEVTAEELHGKQMVINVVVVLAAIVAYILLAEPLGFLITMFLVTAAIMLLLQAKPISTVISAASISILMWLVFEKLLLVQLPDGLLV